VKSSFGRRPIVVARPQSAPQGDINVTPLVDVVLVLLIIFMVVTPLLEKDIKIALPSTEKLEEVSEVPPDQLVVKVTAAGDLEINTVKVAPDAYRAALQEKLDARGDKTVFVLADDRASYARLVFALEGAKAAGATTLGMATDTPPAP
jgi:biopolymer transport protein ExbD